jgi:hypothetical protein
MIFFGGCNWKKVVDLGACICHIVVRISFARLGNTMLCKMKEALPEHANQQAALNDLEEGLKDEYGDVLNQWRLQVEAWEDDQSQSNPFERNADGLFAHYSK